MTPGSRNLTHRRRVATAMTNSLLAVMVAFLAVFLTASSSTAVVDVEIATQPARP